MATTRTNIFEAAKTLSKQLNNIPPQRLGDHDSTYALPRESALEPEQQADAFHVRELLVAAAHRIDPSIEVNSATMNCSLTFRQAYEKFPTHQINAALDEMKSGIARAVQRGLKRAPYVNDMVSLSVASDIPYPFGFALRAALPMPEPLNLEFMLPEGEFRNGNGETVKRGIVPRTTLIDLIETADREQNHEALHTLHQSVCVGAELTHAQVDKLTERLGIDLAGRGAA